MPVLLQQTEKTLWGYDEKVELLYQYQSVMNSYSQILRDYGSGVLLSEVEAHTLNYIKWEEGLTATRLVEITGKTKSGISQILSRLEKHGLIRREVNVQNRREHHIYLTDLGKRTYDCHRSYDRTAVFAQIQYLLEHCTPEEIDAFFKVLQLRIDWFKKVNNTSDRAGKAPELFALLSDPRFTGC